MSMDRRGFIGGTTFAASVALGGGAAFAADPVSTAKSGPIVKPFTEDRGARSAKPAIETEALAAHAVNVKFDQLDAATVAKAKLRVLDLIGCAIGGVPAAGNPELAEVLMAMGGTPEASVIGFSFKTSAAQAAMLNAVFARSFDFEVMTVVVGDRYIGSHNSPTTCMTALALAETQRVSGKEFLTALIVGDDIGSRVLAASGLNLALGWDGAPVYSAIPAAAIASRLLGLNALQTQDAFGLTVDTIAGTNQNIWDSVTDWKLPQGYAARNGIFCAELAKREWVGIGDALRAPYGFFAQYTGGCKQPEILTADLGKVFYAEEYFKPYPVCAAAHNTIEVALAARARSKVKPAQIERIVLRVPAPSLTSNLTKPFVPGRYPQCEANFSLQYQVANALLNGAVTQEHMMADAILGAEVNALVGKVALAPLETGQNGVEIEITTKTGKVIVERHGGTPDRYPGLNPLNYDEIVAKFRQQVAFSKFVPSNVANEIIERVSKLERETNMADFMSLLSRSHWNAT